MASNKPRADEDHTPEPSDDDNYRNINEDLNKIM